MILSLCTTCTPTNKVLIFSKSPPSRYYSIMLCFAVELIQIWKAAGSERNTENPSLLFAVLHDTGGLIHAIQWCPSADACLETVRLIQGIELLSSFLQGVVVTGRGDGCARCCRLCWLRDYLRDTILCITGLKWHFMCGAVFDFTAILMSFTAWSVYASVLC